ncbi:MAG: branched-chain amino acid transport system ATP-binding protein [Candidatus Eremiobacteraeota bacterium]|jgi:branched-chain amino acid transport system ATP-binding protein|nr:branched-chain amino acid transport system ATP-binding protein [Candidatus Eremiobacteraeota bacterium]
MSETILLDAEHIVKTFGGLRAVDDVSMQVREGTIHALIGPNGAGKTTFFNAVSGFAMPDSGRVTFRGTDVTRMMNWRRIAMGMGRTFQTPSVFPELTVDDNIRLGVRAHAKQAFRLRTPGGDAKSVVDKRVDELLGFVNLTALRDRPLAELAHGSQRLCEIAMSLSTDPVMVLLDEPMAGLAEAETDRIIGVIRDLRERLGLTVLFVEHNMRVVLNLAEHITVLDRGKLLAEGPPAEIAANEAVRSAYLGEGVLDHV